MNYALLLSLLSFLGISQLWIGKKSRSQDQADYFLMGRKVGLFSLVMTLLATQVGGGMLLGACEEAYHVGLTALFYPLGMVFGMVLLGLGFGAKFRKMELSTIAEVFEKVYDSSFLRKVASLLSIISLFFILVAQAIAARKFFVSIGFTTPLLFVIMWSILVLYTAFGGLRAVIRTDILQASLIMVAFLIASKGLTVSELSLFHEKSAPWLTWLLMPLGFMLIEQDMGQRCFAAKNPKIVSLAMFIAAATLFCISLFPIAIGILAKSASVAIPHGGSILIAAIGALTNPTILTLLVAAILMAIVSTSDSLLSAISSNIACDFFPKKSLGACRILTLCMGLGTLVLSFFFDNVVDMLMFAYELSVFVLFVPILMALVFKKPKKSLAIAAMIIGALCKFMLK